VLITHGPPLAHLDLLKLGCAHLLRTLWESSTKVAVFGHMHECVGTEWMFFNGLQNAYERTVAAGGGIGNLLFTVWGLAKAYFYLAVEAVYL
jgi:hypothetical protein